DYANKRFSVQANRQIGECDQSRRLPPPPPPPPPPPSNDTSAFRSMGYLLSDPRTRGSLELAVHRWPLRLADDLPSEGVYHTFKRAIYNWSIHRRETACPFKSQTIGNGRVPDSTRLAHPALARKARIHPGIVCGRLRAPPQFHGLGRTRPAESDAQESSN